MLLVARRLRPDESPTGRVTCVNLRQAPAQVTDALAVLNAVRAVPAVQRVDGPPTGGSPLMIGGEQWGELVDSPIDGAPLAGARWRSAEVGQRALALANGVLWSAGRHARPRFDPDHASREHRDRQPAPRADS